MASAVVWNRLEPRPRTNSFTRAIRAEVRDPLWMISRQWQLGELNGDDTGTAVFARIDMQTSKIDRISKKANSNFAPYGDTMPLECMVERETVVPDLLHRIELGRQFMKLFHKKMADAAVPQSPNIENALNDVRNSVAVQFKLPNTVGNDPNVNHPEFYSSPELWQATLAISDGRAIDGYKILETVKANQALNSIITLSATGLNTYLVAAGADLLVWYTSTFSQPANANEDYWLHRHLEYQFACSAPKDGAGYTVLSAQEYYHGHLDWYSFNIQDNNPAFSMLVNGPPQHALIEEAPFTVIPSKISFGGMPAQRYWEMEDRRIDMGNLRASTTDTAQLLVAEFNNVYSNDWMLMPYTVPTGTICNLRKVLVTDVFGQTTYISSASNNEWHMFNLTTQNSAVIDKRLFIPPVIQNMEESEPTESVILMRDEMANMVWGIETTVPDGISTGQPGKEAAQRMVAFLEAETASNPAPPVALNPAKIKYNIMNRVPENWIPFVAVNQGPIPGMAAIQLQRAAMPRQILNNLAKGRVRPRTVLLRGESTITIVPQTLPTPPNVKWSSSFVHEEEVPRSGAILSSTWQRARWHNGQVALWVGRRKQNGRGEGNSGLKFDYLSAK